MQAIASALAESQRSLGNHKKSVAVLKRLYEKDPDEFKSKFISELSRILIVFRRLPPVERLVKFVAVCTPLLGSDDEFLHFLLRHLVQRSRTKDKAVRFRSCQLIAEILSQLPPNAEISDQLFEKLRSSMLKRSQDKVPLVRAQASAALSRLQVPGTTQDEVLTRFLQIMSKDSSVDVRKAALGHVAYTKDTVNDIILRTRDVNPDVRKTTYRLLAQRVDVRSLGSSHIAFLVKEGLHDRSDAVRLECTSMISKQWLSSLDNEPLKLIRLLQEDEELEEEAAMLARCLVTHAPVISPPDFDSIEPSMALYWKEYAYCVKEKPEELERVLPEASILCELLTKYQEDVQVFSRLLELCLLLDFSDELGRSSLISLLQTLLQSLDTNEDSIHSLCEVLKLALPIRELYSRQLAEIISDIKEPLDSQQAPHEDYAGNNIRIERLLDCIEEMQVEQELNMQNGCENEAEKIGQQIAALEQEVLSMDEMNRHHFVETRAWLRCGMLSHNILLDCRVSLRDPIVPGLLSSVILPCVQHHHPAVRKSGIDCLSLFCILSLDAAREHLFLFQQIIQRDLLELKLTALKGIFDLLAVHDILGVAQCDISPHSNSDLFSVLHGFLEHEDSDLQEIAGEGFAKLLVHNRLPESVASTVLQQLLLLLFWPTDGPSPRLRQCLSVFFPFFALGPDSLTRKHQQEVVNVFVPTLHSVFQAPLGSNISAVDTKELSRFLCRLTKPAISFQQDTCSEDNEDYPDGNWSFHAQLAVAVLAFLRDYWEEDCNESRFLAELLCHLEVDSMIPKEVFQLLALLKDVSGYIEDRVVLRCLTNFEKNLMRGFDASLLNCEKELPPESVLKNLTSTFDFLSLHKVSRKEKEFALNSNQKGCQQIVTRANLRRKAAQYSLRKLREQLSNDSDTASCRSSEDFTTSGPDIDSEFCPYDKSDNEKDTDYENCSDNSKGSSNPEDAPGFNRSEKDDIAEETQNKKTSGNGESESGTANTCSTADVCRSMPLGPADSRLNKIPLPKLAKATRPLDENYAGPNSCPC